MKPPPTHPPLPLSQCPVISINPTSFSFQRESVGEPATELGRIPLRLNLYLHIFRTEPPLKRNKETGLIPNTSSLTCHSYFFFFLRGKTNERTRKTHNILPSSSRENQWETKPKNQGTLPHPSSFSHNRHCSYLHRIDT